MQVTYFKCGGVSLGVAAQHTLVDGASGTHFINSWDRVAQGLDVKIPPFVDRTFLFARKPPTPSFPHVEHQPPPSIESKNQKLECQTNPKCVFSQRPEATFKISRHQINLLKAQCRDESNLVMFKFRHEVLADTYGDRIQRRVRCGLSYEQETIRSIVVDGRTRLNPAVTVWVMRAMHFSMLHQRQHQEGKDALFQFKFVPNLQTNLGKTGESSGVSEEDELETRDGKRKKTGPDSYEEP
ncbi:hypothetical protein IFM89_035310 [Coptis chinensis]|uniref:Uncharacterized protein n=1 Tax=Coptis chinensis TaxID=261450 RepID=A0A835IHU6_9MAGN|nr:hypothetical protein IFM89_035310 [Coptis chinensis]